LSNNCAIIIGIILQLIGAAYIVVQSFRTTRKLQNYSAPGTITYGNVAQVIEALANELSSQFFQQLVGFVFLLAGSAFQLYVALSA
jgi:hypothetical protein